VRLVSADVAEQFAHALDNVLDVVWAGGGKPESLARLTVHADPREHRAAEVGAGRGDPEGEHVMGRILDLCGEVAAAADEGPEGLVLPPEAWDRLRADWSDDDIQDALGFVKDSMLQSELVEAADSLSARLVELLGTWGDAKGFAAAVEGGATLPVEVIRQIAHRLDRLEEILELYRDEKGPDRKAFDALQRRLIDQGIEDEMRPDWERQDEDES
jgi:hypothetical protein